jgi:anti-anti-sigma regulatory factor/anti-sigma regulatory factor (Ser/Thr protein kinase)
VDGELTCQAECGRPVGVVRVRGALSLVTAPALRSAVHACLADGPDAVVLDLSALSTDSDATLDLLSALAQAAVAAAGPSIVLCAPSARFGDRLGELAITRHLSVHTNLADALAHAHETGPVRRLQRRISLDYATSDAARNLVDQACLEWGMLGVADRAGTVVTELVANAVLHAATDMVVSVADLRDHLHIAVQDGSTRRPRLGGRTDANGSGGYGLLVVDALAAAWGVLPARTGKTVWATVPTTRWR